MQHIESIRYLELAGFQYKPAESPDLWEFLESHFAGPQGIGSKFTPMPARHIAELIGMGEEALLEAMVLHHRKTGSPGRVARVLDLPYAVGTAASMPLANADSGHVLKLIDKPGTARERVVHVVPVSADEIPSTSRITVIGGLYADGRTTGYFDLYPGEKLEEGELHGKDDAVAYLATRAEIDGLLHDMEAKVEDITVVSRSQCDAMLGKARAFRTA